MSEFEKDVISRLSKIETKIDGIKQIEETAITALHKASVNEKDICEMKDTQRWAWRTIAGIILAYIINIILAIKGG